MVSNTIQHILIPRLEEFGLVPRLQKFDLVPRLQEFGLVPRLQEFGLVPRLLGELYRDLCLHVTMGP